MRFILEGFIIMAGGPNPLESSGPNLWAVAAHNEIPDQAWEYHARKAANDVRLCSLCSVFLCHLIKKYE